jgi:hypothetical protein
MSKQARPIGVGIIGASAERGWALNAHIPAIQALPQFRLAAVSTSRAESAKSASVKFGVPAFDNPQELASHPDVDLVVVTVKVPQHLALVEAVNGHSATAPKKRGAWLPRRTGRVCRGSLGFKVASIREYRNCFAC